MVGTVEEPEPQPETDPEPDRDWGDGWLGGGVLGERAKAVDQRNRAEAGMIVCAEYAVNDGLHTMLGRHK